MTNNKIIEKKFNFFGCTVNVWKINSSWHPYPWGFSVIDLNGKEHRFGGIPNQCETEHSALMRGWYRAKWIADGSFYKRYK